MGLLVIINKIINDINIIKKTPFLTKFLKDLKGVFSVKICKLIYLEPMLLSILPLTFPIPFKECKLGHH